jgi:hypothetical protein
MFNKTTSRKLSRQDAKAQRKISSYFSELDMLCASHVFPNLQSKKQPEFQKYLAILCRF